MCGETSTQTVGVAPDAQWIACNSIANGYYSGIVAGFQWVTDPDGDPMTTDDVPDVVNNSWGLSALNSGYYPCRTRFWSAIDGCEAAGVAVIFSAGNDGSAASTIGEPADRCSSPYNSFSVGATQNSSPFGIAYFSSRGPAPASCGSGDLLIKPEIVAPGMSIYSCIPGGGYEYKQGTSMAAPHVSGVIALMRSANPNVDVITMKQIIMDNAVDLGATGEDNTYGHGLVDAYECVLDVLPPGTFTDVTASSFSGTTYGAYGLAFGDYNGDGWEDIYFAVDSENGYSQVFRNNQSGTFVMASDAAVLQGGGPRRPYWLDVDNDGSLDLFAPSQGVDDVGVEWSGSSFVGWSTQPGAGNEYYHSDWIDVDNDGDLDYYTGTYPYIGTGANRLYLNDGVGNFTVDVMSIPGTTSEYEQGIAWCDYDLDGDLDVLVSYESGDMLYENLGGNVFADVHDQLFGGSSSKGIGSWGDYDGDGYLDLATDYGNSFRLFHNNAGQSFTEIPWTTHRVATDHKVTDICWQDMNNDGYLDAVVAASNDDPAIYSGNGDGTFDLFAALIGATDTGSISGLTTADYDQDGDLDLFSVSGAKLQRNDLSEGNWSHIKLVGTVSNRDAIGARIDVTAGGIHQTRMIGVGDAQREAGTRVVCFGLGTATQITNAVVTWPSGIVQDITSEIFVNQRTTITEPNHQVTAQIDIGGQVIPIVGNVLCACPAGDGHELVVTIDFDDSEVSGTVLASDVSLGFADAGYGNCGDPYNDADGTSSNGYTVTVRRKYFYGCNGCIGGGCDPESVGVPTVWIEYQGQQIGSIGGLVVRSRDLNGDGVINLSDTTILTQALTAQPGDPAFTTCADLNGDGLINLSDISRFTGHNGHSCPTNKVNRVEYPIEELITCDSSDGGTKHRLVLKDTRGVEAATLELRVGAGSGVNSWRVLENSDDIWVHHREQDGVETLSLTILNLGERADAHLDLVELTTEDSATPMLGGVLAMECSALQSGGTVVWYTGETQLAPVDASVTGVRRVYPNPFNPQVTIEYSVAKPGHVAIDIYDVSGRLVKTVVDQVQRSAGVESVIWNGTDEQGQRAASGVYFWRMKTDDHRSSGRVLLVK